MVKEVEEKMGLKGWTGWKGKQNYECLCENKKWQIETLKIKNVSIKKLLVRNVTEKLNSQTNKKSKIRVWFNMRKIVDDFFRWYGAK